MIKYFKVCLMLVGSFLLISCGGSSNSGASASSLLEGKSFYTPVDNTFGNYQISKFENGLIEDTLYDLNTKSIINVSQSRTKYTLDGNKMTVTDINDTIVTYTVIVSSTSNGVKLTYEKDSSGIINLYNTFDDAQKNSKPSRQISASVLEGKTFYPPIDVNYSNYIHNKSYSTQTFSNGTLTNNMYSDFTMNETSSNYTTTSNYTLDGKTITIDNEIYFVLSLPNNGVELVTNYDAASQSYSSTYLYLTKEDAKKHIGMY